MSRKVTDAGRDTGQLPRQDACAPMLRQTATQLEFALPAPGPVLIVLGRDPELEGKARSLLEQVHAIELARIVRVEWNARLCSTAGRAEFRRQRISLNPRLREHGSAEIDRTLRHELAHLLAQFRAGKRRIPPHGVEWKKACHDLGIAGERRTHTLPFPIQQQTRRFLYQCPRCGKEFPRVRRIRRTVACLQCCRTFNDGKFDRSAQLRLVQSQNS